MAINSTVMGARTFLKSMGMTDEEIDERISLDGIEKQNRIKNNIKDLLKTLDDFSNDKSNLDKVDYSDIYWGIKLNLVEEISKAYSTTPYSPEVIRALRIPAAICTLIVNLAREILK